MKKITKNAMLVAGAALATTGAGVAVNNTAHADAAAPSTQQVPASDTQTSVATNQDQESTLAQKNQQDQNEIDSIQQNAADVKNAHAQEIAQATSDAQASYQSQATQINNDYQAKIDSQAQINSQAEASLQSENAQTLASAQNAQSQAEADQQAAINNAKSAQANSLAQAKSDQQAAISQADSQLAQAKSDAQSQLDAAAGQNQTALDQALKDAQTARDNAKNSAQQAYNDGVNKENQSFDQAKTNANASNQDAIKQASQKVANDQQDVNNKQVAYDNAVKNAPKINHGGVAPVKTWGTSWKTDANGHKYIPEDLDKDYTDVIHSVNELPLNYDPNLSINYKADVDHSEAVDPNTGLSLKQLNELNEYALVLVNGLLKQNGLKPVYASQEVLNYMNGISAQDYADHEYSEQDLSNGLQKTTANEPIDDGVTIKSVIYPNDTSVPNEKLSMLGFAEVLNGIINNNRQSIIDNVRISEEAGGTPSISFVYPTHGLYNVRQNGKLVLTHGQADVTPTIMIAEHEHFDSDYNNIIDGGTPIANTGFVDSIRAAQAGTPTPDLNNASVVNAKKALDQANSQLKRDQQALNDLKSKDPMTNLAKQHNAKLSELKTTLDNAIKSANATYTKAVNEAHAKYTKQGAQSAYDNAIKNAQAKHDNAVKNANIKYNAAVKAANDAYDLAVKQAKGDPSYISDLKTQLTNKLNALIKDDQAKIDALKAERDAKLADLKKTTDEQSNVQVQAILAKYGVSDAQLKAKIDPLLADIQANKETIASLQHIDAQNAAKANATNATQNAIKGVSHGTNGSYGYVDGATIEFPKNESTNVANHGEASANEGYLPQTSAKSSFAIVALGAISAMLGLGLAKKCEY